MKSDYHEIAKSISENISPSCYKFPPDQVYLSGIFNMLYHVAERLEEISEKLPSRDTVDNG